MKKLILRITLFMLFISIFFVRTVYAESSYVLPYPNFMPGNNLYKISEFLDVFKKYYAFGDFAQYKYYQALSDKKLVEAKTLFEYKQYPLALKALKKSDEYFEKISVQLKNAKAHSKDVSEKEKILKDETLKHLEVLDSMKVRLPVTFIWREEKSQPVSLNLKKAIDDSAKVRSRVK